MLRISVYIMILILSGVFYSCSPDEIIKNDQDPLILDSLPEYDWELINMSGYNVMDLLVVDTSNVFIASAENVLRYNGSTFEPLNLGVSFNARRIGTYDNQTLFIGGRFPGSPAWNKAVLIKYNGSSEFYEVPYDSTVSMHNFLFEGPSKFWFSATESEYAYSFDNGIFKRYSLSDGGKKGYFYKDHYGQLHLFTIIPSIEKKDVMKYYIFNENLDSFEFRSEETLYQGNGADLSFRLVECGSDLIDMGGYSLSYFNGSGWTKYLSTKVPNTPWFFTPEYVIGNNKDSIMIYDYYAHNPFRKVGLFSYQPGRWNFEKWLGTEIVGTEVFVRNMEIYNNNIYGIFYSPFMQSVSFLLVGRKIL